MPDSTENEGLTGPDDEGETDLLLSNTVHVTAAAIKNLAAAPFEIVPLVAGKSLIPMAFLISFMKGGVAYANGNDLVIAVGNAVSGPSQLQIDAATAALLTDDVDAIAAAGVGAPANQGSPIVFRDLPISLFVNGSDFTDGTGTLDVTVWYVVG